MRRRILLLVLGMTALVVASFAIPLAILARTSAIDDAQRSATNEARAVGYTLQSGMLTSAQITDYLAKLPQTDDRRTAVILPDGTVLGSLPPSGAPPVQALPTGTYPQQYPSGSLPGGGAPIGRGDHGDSDQQPPQLMHVRGGEVAQLAVAGGGPDGADAGTYQIEVYVSNNALDSGVTGRWALIAGASVLLLLVGLIAGELLTRRIVRPLLDTARTANRISAGDVTARAPAGGPPEVAEVGAALNRLADRIDELIAEERETVADLSHRLRTPLTALRLDAEALRDPVEAERVGTHVSALERMLTAVIRAARRPQREGRMPSCDARAIVAERFEFWSALAEDQGRASSVELPEQPLLVRAAGEDFAAAVDALLENVVAHTPEGTAYSVRLSSAAGFALLEIADEGPGFTDDVIVRGRSDRGSSGLGLSIASRCAEASGGSMTIATAPGGGALIQLRLGPP